MFTPLTFNIAVLAAIIIPRVVGGLYLQVPAFIALGAGAVYSGLAPLWGGVLIALSPFVVGLLTVLYFYWLGRRALSGKMGEPQKWMAEYVRDGDHVFINSLDQLSEMDKKEIILIADSKQELKELAIERADEPVGDRNRNL